MSYDILIVDDQEDIRKLIADILEDEGYTTRTSANGYEAIEQIKTRRPHLVILDVWLNDNRFEGVQVLDLIKQLHPLLPVIMISGHGTIETAINTLKKGAYDFIEKPFKTDKLLSLVTRGIELLRLNEELQTLRQEVDHTQELIGISSQANILRQTIEKVSKTNSRILIEGNAGTGKEMLAKLIHQKSNRDTKPFIILNCANLDPRRFEEEFFGKEGKVGPGQVDIKLGILEKADRGTLFLEGITDMPLETQAKILQTFREDKFYRVGGTTPLLVDVRIISSTDRNIRTHIEKGLFREDLYYRLNVVPITIPPLASRCEDIMVLAEFFMKKFSLKMGGTLKKFSKDAKIPLESYAWPGNVRQLRNMMEWIMIMYPEASEITSKMLPAEITLEKQEIAEKIVDRNLLLSLDLREAREEFEKAYLSLHIRRFNGNISKTASAVGMERTALHRKIKLLDLVAVGEAEMPE